MKRKKEVEPTDRIFDDLIETVTEGVGNMFIEHCEAYPQDLQAVVQRNREYRKSLFDCMQDNLHSPEIQEAKEALHKLQEAGLNKLKGTVIQLL